MRNDNLYFVNIAMEATIVIVLSFLLFSFIKQKKRFETTVPLTILMIVIICTLINQILTWLILIYDVIDVLGLAPLKMVYFFDYFLTYIVGVTFYFYVEALSKEGYKLKGIEHNRNRKVAEFLMIWGLFSFSLYAVFINSQTIFYVENDNFYYSVIAYVFMHFSVNIPYLFTLGDIVKHRSVISKKEMLIISSFIFLPLLLIIVDENFGLCISYMMISLLTVMLYLRIDLERSMLIEEQERNLLEYQTEIMLSQMQPHFLYNILTTISAMCETQNALGARDVTNRFADYFRVNLDSLGKGKTIPFTKELEHIKTYLWLEKIRFEDSLNINYEIGPTEFSVPSLSVQPIVENAVKHGILPKEDPGTLTIKTQETQKEYLVIIEDDGVGFDTQEVLSDDKSHVGLENVKKRLELIVNGRCTVESAKGKGTKVTLVIPKVM